jgi:hypothetical protein
LSDLKNVLKELHEKVDRLEAKVDKVETKAAGKDDKKLRMILIGPPGAGTSSSIQPEQHNHAVSLFLRTPSIPSTFFFFSFLTACKWRPLVYSGDTFWNKQNQKKRISFRVLFFGEYFPIFDQISHHSSRRPILSLRKEATIKNQKEVLTITGSGKILSGLVRDRRVRYRNRYFPYVSVGVFSTRTRFMTRVFYPGRDRLSDHDAGA